jgi:hypothetical protein
MSTQNSDSQNFLSTWARDYIRGGVTRDDYNDEYRSDPFRNFVGGVLGGGTGQQAITDKEAGDKRKASREAWENAGIHTGKLTEMGLSKDSSKEAILGGLSKIGDDKEETGHTRNMETVIKPLEMSLAATEKTGQRQHDATMTQLSNQNSIAMAGLTQSNNQFMAQMADSKDQRAMELQMRREDLDRMDKRDERNRRRDSIAQLTAGIAALGAAFAF